MQVKRYEVSGISEALTKIKEDLGPDAIILSAKKINGQGNSAIEVMAARDEKVGVAQKNTAKHFPSGNDRLTDNHEDIYKFFHGEIGELKDIILSAKKENSLSRELEELKETMDKFFDILGARKGKVNQDVNHQVYYQLLACGFSRAGACGLMDKVNSKISSQQPLNAEKAIKIIEDYIITSLPSRQGQNEEKRIKAFVGATGVGKTTTLAKLAALYSITKKMKVGLITTDTFRIAATEQLKTYAKIMGLRVEVASTKESFQKALQLFSDKDIVLIDTTGRSSLDSRYGNSPDVLVPGYGIETNLLISATASEDNLQDIIIKYSSFDYDNLIVTKIDESRRFGSLYDVINKAGKPVSYFTCGQNVPQDIEEVTPRKIANLIMGGTVH
jgi:flagellar biosynthesis protein FlhF